MFVYSVDKGFTTANVFSTAINYTFTHVKYFLKGLDLALLVIICRDLCVWEFVYNLHRLVYFGLTFKVVHMNFKLGTDCYSIDMKYYKGARSVLFFGKCFSRLIAFQKIYVCKKKPNEYFPLTS